MDLLPDVDSPSDDVEALLSFLGVSSPEGWDNVWNASQVAFRQTRKFETSLESVYAWVRATEIFAEPMQVAEFDKKKVFQAISNLRNCTVHKADFAIEEAQHICASVGIAFVLIPGFKKTGISGCARWLSSTKAMIALSNRYKTDDLLWFTFFHELAHLLLHRKTHAFVIDNAKDVLLDKVIDPTIQKQEEEANRFSANTLIPPDALAEFINNKIFTNKSIKSFSDYIGVGPGIVVGRLQHEEFLEPFQGNRLKQVIELHVETIKNY